MVTRARQRAERRSRRPQSRRTIDADIQQHYQVLLENLRRPGADRRGPVRTVGVSSCAERGGASTVAAQLAMTAAAGNARVLLVDANLAEPAVERIFAAVPAPGLSEVLRDGTPLETALQPSEFANLSLLVAGTGTPQRVFACAHLGDVLEALQSAFDLLVFDLPPRLHRTPALRLAGLLDGVLVVVQSGRTSWELAMETRRVLAHSQVRLLGAVLNQFV